MPKKSYEESPLLKILHHARQTLIALGTPPLFALKILAWTTVFLLKLFWQLFLAAVAILGGATTTAIWLLQTLGSALGEIRPYLAGLFLPRLRGFRGFLSQKYKSIRQFSLPLRFRPPTIQLPRPSLPSVSKPSLTFLEKIGFAALGGGLIFLFIFVPYWVYSQISLLPNPKILATRDIPISTKIYDRSGLLLYQFYGDENRNWVKLNELPKYLVQATLAIEDKNFYHHSGFDITGIARAVLANSSGNSIQGGSTITQQLIKSALLTPAQTWERKIKELVLSVWTERIYPKDQILEMYLNQVPYGSTAYGIDAAAQTYFGKKAKNLTLAEAALLAGLPEAPSTYSPFGVHPELSKDRQRQVLTAMVNQGYITQFSANAAAQEPLKFTTPETGIKAPHFVMYVKDYLVQKYGSRIVERGGLEVTTSLDYPTYETVSKILKDGVEKQKYLNVGNAAALVTNPKTGEILAMVGSRDFFDLAHDGNVNVTVAQRSPGSSIKPLNYALAFEKGLITASTIIDDSPVIYKYPGGSPYAPTNYDNRFHGKVPVRVALGASYNVPAVKVLEKNGVDNFIDFAQKMGITTWTDRSRFGLALTLGGGEVKMTDMATAYSAFANAGAKVNLTPVLKVVDYRGTVLEDNSNRSLLTANPSPVVSPRTAFLISNILADDSARAPTFGPGSILNIPGHAVAVKTGTTEHKADNWTIGYSFGPDPRLVAVWVGNNDNSPMSPFLESGNTGAAAIWSPIMTTLLAGQPDAAIPVPQDIVAVTVCSLNGLLPCDNCPFTKTEYFARGTEPKQACNFTKEEVDKILHPEANKPQ